MGLGCCWRTWGGGYDAPRGCISYKARNKPTHGIKRARRCNYKQQKRKCLISHYITYKTVVLHISGKIHAQQKPKTPRHNKKTARMCVSAYLNPHITCHTTPPHPTHRHTSEHTTHAAPYTTATRRINPTWERCTPYLYHTALHTLYTHIAA